MQRIREAMAARRLADQILFTAARNRLTSVDVRARQIVPHLKAAYVRASLLDVEEAQKARAAIWVAVADAEKVRRLRGTVPQLLDVINPSVEQGQAYFEMVNLFDGLILNTPETLNYLPRLSSGSWRANVIAHHHCNTSGWRIPEARLERPRVIGYVGQPAHLHDVEQIEKLCRSLGLRFLMSGDRDLAAYRQIDIGIAWTRRDPLRDDTRSNIKVTNFCSFGIPSVVSDYSSYRAVDRRLGGGASLIAATLDEFLEKLATVAGDEDLRRSLSERALPAYNLYSPARIAGEYEEVIQEVERARFAAA